MLPRAADVAFWKIQHVDHCAFMSLALVDPDARAEAARLWEAWSRLPAVPRTAALLPLLDDTVLFEQGVHRAQTERLAWLGWMQPETFDHFAEEGAYFRALLTEGVAPRAEARRWADLLADHAAMGATQVDPPEAAARDRGLALAADARRYARLPRLDVATVRALLGVDGAIGAYVRALARVPNVLQPGLAAHVLREGRHFRAVAAAWPR